MSLEAHADLVYRVTQAEIMTLDWAEGIGAGDNDALDVAGHDRRALGARVLQMFLNHALRDGYFHGDMHQGNLFVDLKGNIIPVDFGIMRRLDKYFFCPFLLHDGISN